MSNDWNTIKENGPNLVVNETLGYKPIATSLTEINTSGWESTPSINWYGNVLSYSYSPVDQFYLKNTNTIRLSGSYLSGFSSNESYSPTRQEIYLAEKKDNVWLIKNAGSPVNDPTKSQFAQQLVETRNLFYFVSKTNTTQGIYSCTCKQNTIIGPTLLPNQINFDDLTNNPYNNPFLSNSGILVYDDGQKIYFSNKIGDNLYSEPTTNEILDLISTGLNLTEPWLSPDGNQIVFTVANGIIGTFNLNEPTSDINPAFLIAIEDSDNCAGIGNATLDKNGNIYFSYIYQRLNEQDIYEYDSDIFVVEKL